MSDHDHSYLASGVDVERGYEVVRRISPLAKATRRAEVLGGLGGFGGLFAVPSGYREPVLVSGADGVGTKLKLAFTLQRHDTIGIDCVAMCVNDIAAQGAEPLFFLDYLAMGRLVPALAEEVVRGVADGCRIAGCALIGGETAEMPGFYPEGEYDLAGFAVGIVERTKIIDGSRIEPGDALVGLASSGPHSNGFSLIRRIIEAEGLDLGSVYEGMDAPLGSALLTPTRIYVAALRDLQKTVDLRGVAHITGGGFYENIPRALPPAMRAAVTLGRWRVPPVFSFLRAAGKLSDKEMFSTFNMGIGMVVVVPRGDVDATLACLAGAGVDAWHIGTLEAGEGGVLLG